MNGIINARIHGILSLTALLLWAGCLNLKPVVEDVRYFVLTPVPIPDPPGSALGMSVGVGPVTVPGYLLQDRLAIQRGNNEIRYPGNLRWAERLDKNIQRVLAANLGSLLGSTNILLSAWRRNEVDAEVFVSVARFDLDEAGKVTLEAQWRITTPGSDTSERAGACKISFQGTPASVNPDEAVAGLSTALGEFSREIAGSLIADPGAGREEQGESN